MNKIEPAGLASSLLAFAILGSLFMPWAQARVTLTFLEIFSGFTKSGDGGEVFVGLVVGIAFSVLVLLGIASVATTRGVRVMISAVGTASLIIIGLGLYFTEVLGAGGFGFWLALAAFGMMSVVQFLPQPNSSDGR